MVKIIRQPAICPTCKSKNVKEVDHLAWWTLPILICSLGCVVVSRIVWRCQDCKCEFR